MRTDLERIRELEAELRPLWQANWLYAVEEAFRVRHDRGFGAAALGVFHERGPRPRDGGIDFFIERLTPEQAPTVKGILGPIEGAYEVSSRRDARTLVMEEAHGLPFAGVHHGWLSTKNLIAVVSGLKVQDIDLEQLNTSLLSRVAK